MVENGDMWASIVMGVSKVMVVFFLEHPIQMDDN